MDASLAELFNQPEEPEGFTIDYKRFIWGVVQRLKLITLTILLFMSVALSVAFLVLEHTWQSQVTLLKKEQQDSFQVGRYGLPYTLQSYSLKTLLDTIKLPQTLQEAMLRSGVAIASYDMAKLVDIRLAKESKTFSLMVTWNNAEIAASLANHLADVLIERNQHLRKNEIDNAMLHYSQRLDSAEGKLYQQTELLRQFEVLHDIADFKTEITLLLEKRQDLQLSQGKLQGKQKASEDQIIGLSEAITSEPEMVVQSSYYVNPLQKQLSQLEWELTQARGRYTDNNPKVMDLLQRISRLAVLIDEGKDEQTPSNTYAHNPVREELTLRRYSAQSQNKNLVIQSLQTQNLLASLQKRIDQLSTKSRQYTKLQRQLQSATQLQQDLRQRVDALNVLRQGNNGDFEILERAKPPQQRQSSGRKLLLIAAFILAFGFAFSLAILMTYFDSKIRTLLDLSELIQTDVIAEFQQLPKDVSLLIEDSTLHSDTAKLFRRFVNDINKDCTSNGFAIVSGCRQQGRTLVAYNLAKAASLKGAQTLLVDADLSQLSGQDISQSCSINRLNNDLKSTLLGNSVDEDLSDNNNLSLLPCHHQDELAPQDSLLLGGNGMRDLIKRMGKRYQQSFYDLPPLLEDEAAFEAAVNIGQVVLVLRSGLVSKKHTEQLLKRCERHDVKVAGVILVDVPRALMQQEMEY